MTGSCKVVSDNNFAFKYIGCYEFSFQNKPFSLVLNPGLYDIELFGAEGGYLVHSTTTAIPGKGGYARGFFKTFIKQIFDVTNFVIFVYKL